MFLLKLSVILAPVWFHQTDLQQKPAALNCLQKIGPLCWEADVIPSHPPWPRPYRKADRALYQQVVRKWRSVCPSTKKSADRVYDADANMYCTKAHIPNCNVVVMVENRKIELIPISQDIDNWVARGQTHQTAHHGLDVILAQVVMTDLHYTTLGRSYYRSAGQVLNIGMERKVSAGLFSPVTPHSELDIDRKGLKLSYELPDGSKRQNIFNGLADPNDEFGIAQTKLELVIVVLPFVKRGKVYNSVKKLGDLKLRVSTQCYIMGNRFRSVGQVNMQILLNLEEYFAITLIFQVLAYLLLKLNFGFVKHVSAPQSWPKHLKVPVTIMRADVTHSAPGHKVIKAFSFVSSVFYFKSYLGPGAEYCCDSRPTGLPERGGDHGAEQWAE